MPTNEARPRDLAIQCRRGNYVPVVHIRGHQQKNAGDWGPKATAADRLRLAQLLLRTARVDDNDELAHDYAANLAAKPENWHTRVCTVRRWANAWHRRKRDKLARRSGPGNSRRIARPAIALTDAEHATLLDLLQRERQHPRRSNRRRALAITLGLHGLRAGEVAAARQGDLVGNTLAVRTLKRGQRRRLILAPQLADELRTHAPPWHRDTHKPLLPTSRGKPIPPSQPGKWMAWIADRLGIDRRFHDLRHTAAARLYARTKDPLAIMRLLGHRSLRSTHVYLLSSIPTDAIDLTPEQTPDPPPPRLRLFRPA